MPAVRRGVLPTDGVRIASDRCWVFPAGRRQVWAAMADTGRYREWWPWLVAFEAPGLARGARWDCTVQPPVPYRLRFALDLTAVDPGESVAAEVSGDVVGTAGLTLADGPAGTTEVRLSSSLAPGNRALRVVAALALPLARFGHDWVLDTGARQFSEAL